MFRQNDMDAPATEESLARHLRCYHDNLRFEKWARQLQFYKLCRTRLDE